MFSKIGPLCVATLLASGVAAAQGGHGGGGHGGGMGRGGGMPGGSMGRPDNDSIPHSGSGAPRNTPAGGNGSATSTSRTGLQLGPPGRWWDDKKFAKSLGLNSDQQKRMDTVFAQNRDSLVTKYDTLQKAQTRLETLTHADHPDQNALFSEIDHVAQARADLEKANTRMLLQIRGEMTPEQIDRLEEQR